MKSGLGGNQGNVQEPDLVEVDGSNATIVLPMLSKGERIFSIDPIIDGARTWEVTGINARKINASFEVDGLHPQTLPADWAVYTLSGVWDGNAFTPSDIGRYQIVAVWNGTQWEAIITGVFN